MSGRFAPAGVPGARSSHSDSGGACVETAVLPDRRIAVRHSKQPAGPVLSYTPAQWHAYIADVKAGRFDSPDGFARR